MTTLILMANAIVDADIASKLGELRETLLTAIDQLSDNAPAGGTHFGLVMNQFISSDWFDTLLKLEKTYGEPALNRWWVATCVLSGRYEVVEPGIIQLVDYSQLTSDQIDQRLAALGDKLLTNLIAMPVFVPQDTQSFNERMMEVVDGWTTRNDRIFLQAIEPLRGLPFCYSWALAILVKSNRFTDEFIDTVRTWVTALAMVNDPDGIDTKQLDDAVDDLVARHLIFKPV